MDELQVAVDQELAGSGLGTPEAEVAPPASGSDPAAEFYDSLTPGAIALKIADLEKQLAEVREPATNGKVPKNKVAGKPDPNRKYVLLEKNLASWGRVPQQQADLAAILSQHMELGVEYPEAAIFDLVTDQAAEFDSIAGSRQHPTYLLRYYRGLKNDQKHCGFVGRGFLRVIG